MLLQVYRLINVIYILPAPGQVATAEKIFMFLTELPAEDGVSQKILARSSILQAMNKLRLFTQTIKRFTSHRMAIKVMVVMTCSYPGDVKKELGKHQRISVIQSIQSRVTAA